MRVIAVVLAVLVPALAVGAVDAVDAAAGSRSHPALVHHTRAARDGGDSGADDMNLIRVTMNAARTQRLLRIADRDALIANTPPSPAQIARASRSLERKALSSKTYVRPVPGPVTQWYGSHPGIDIAPPYGTPIGAAHSGVVTFVGWDDGYGMHVEVAQLDGYVTTYSHMSAFTVKVGQLVLAGQQLGNVGSTGDSTGPHLHFEVHLPNGQRTDPGIWLFQHGVIP
jgi:murein DD-endopeptidase MepM/ murein hydrolase activator NlpD